MDYYQTLAERIAQMPDEELSAEVDGYSRVGKFQSLLDELAYEFCMMPNETLGTSDGFGHYAYVAICPDPPKTNTYPYPEPHDIVNADYQFHRVARASHVEYTVCEDGTLQGPGMGPIVAAIVATVSSGAA